MIGLAIGVLVGGMVVGALWTFVIGLAGAPASIVALKSKTETGAYPTWSIMLVAASQLVALLIWSAACVGSAAALTVDSSGFGVWILWGAFALVSFMPGASALKDSADASAPAHLAITISTPLNFPGFLILAFAPGVREAAFGWVPVLAFRNASLGKSGFRCLKSPLP